MFTQPLITLSPAATSVGSDSPVRAVVFIDETPSSTMPSSGIFSPGFTTIISPCFTSSGDTVMIPFSVSRFALSGRMSISAVIDFLLRSVAICSNSSPIEKNSITNTASGYSPTANAPIVATHIKKHSSKISP